MDPDDQLLENVGRRIAELRELRGKTQAEIAEAIGTTLTNYQRIESGSQNLTLRTMGKVARAIGIEVAELLMEPRTPRPRPGRPRKGQAPG